MSTLASQSKGMRVEYYFDQQAVIERRANVMFGVQLSVPEVLPLRRRPAAYALALDLEPGADNISFCENIAAAHKFIRHLRATDQVALIACGQEAEVVFPLGFPDDKPDLHAILDHLYPARGSNRMAAEAVAAAELVHTRYAERFVVPLWNGLNVAQPQPTLIRDLRLRLDLLDFCEWAEPLGPHRDHCFPVDGGRIEFALGDLLAGEQRNVFFNLTVPPLPLVFEHEHLSLEGEPILAVELEWTEVSKTRWERRSLSKTLSARDAAALIP